VLFRVSFFFTWFFFFPRASSEGWFPLIFPPVFPLEKTNSPVSLLRVFFSLSLSIRWHVGPFRQKPGGATSPAGQHVKRPPFAFFLMDPFFPLEGVPRKGTLTSLMLNVPRRSSRIFPVFKYLWVPFHPFSPPPGRPVLARGSPCLSQPFFGSAVWYTFGGLFADFPPRDQRMSFLPLTFRLNR